jgi:hypothetical protein
LRLRLFTDAACKSSNPCVAPVGGVPFLTGRKGDGKSCTAKGPGQTIGPGARSIGPSRTPGPESLLQREKDRKRGQDGHPHLAPAPFYPSPRDDLPPVGPFSPLSRGETWGQAPCFVSERGAHPAAAAGKTTPVVPTRSGDAEGVGGDNSQPAVQPTTHGRTTHDLRSTTHDPQLPIPHVDADASPLPMH